MAYQIQTRKDTTANWTSSNPILADGEMGIEWTGVVNQFKIGNAVDDWSTLPYSFSGAGTGDVIKVGTPVDSQIGVWTGDGTIEGTSGFTYDGAVLDIIGNITLSGTVDGIDVAVSVAANTVHLSSDGSDHGFIDQDVTIGASPTLDGGNITGLVASSTEKVDISIRAGTSTIAAGVPVYITSYNVSGWYVVEPADNSDSAKMPAIGITDESTTTSATSKVTVGGRVLSLDTSAYTQNESLYVGVGVLTDVKPIGTALIQKMGLTARVHASAGVIQVVGAGRTNDVPNIANGSFWVGDGDGVATAINFDTAIETNLIVAANTAARYIVDTGEKTSASDAGTFGEMSIVDDYLYMCVQTGTVGNAIWKRAPLFAT